MAAPILPTPREFKGFQDKRQQVMQAHQAYSEKLKQKEDQARARGGDLDLAGRLFKILDSRVPKPARQFLTREMAQFVGVDPKSESFKGVSQVLTSLDPDSLKSMSSGLAGQLKGIPPGQVTEIVKGVMTGQVGLDQLLNQFGTDALGGGAGQDTLQGGESTVEKGAGPKEDRLEDTEPTVAQPYGEGPAAVQSFEGQRTIPEGAKQVSPSLVGALGLDSRTRLRNNDLTAAGLRIPFDEKRQDELATSITTRSTGLSGTLNEAALITDLFSGRPETLGPVGTVLRGVQSTVRQVEGLLNIIKPGTTNEADPDDAGTQALAKRVGDRLSKLHGLDATAESSARVQAAVLGLAYRMALARDIPGNRLTNGIINQHLAQLGQSASPEQFKAVLSDTLSSLTREFDENIRRTTGVSGLKIMAQQLTNDDIVRMTKPGSIDVLPIDMAKTLREEIVSRKEGKPGGLGVQPISPTLAEEEQTLGKLETEKKQRDIARSDQSMEIERTREDRAARSEERALGREDRLADASIRSNELSREKFEYEKQHDVKLADERRNKEIGDAFLAFGNAIAGSFGRSGGGGGSIPSLGGGQDQGAFRINPAPQRTPPRPVGGG